QDIYSYLANGSIVRQGLDPYSSGPVELLGVEHHLARSVPFIWAHSPSPYGPVALGTAAVISHITGDSIFWGVLAHRA
ncbi:polyprenol phosphomannose-dependent alpha 1,6 mannosyltransferase MptB, partial [Staphylococcus aureus]|nr:polyprenol phosphomannose-dependent alpha 1,6 mannosyltransferase MptB [Staphylococcus aureus]